MKLTCLASGSSGNCYLLENNNEVLILDCGIPIKAIKQGLNWDISKVVGVLCSHEHKDHSKALDDLRDMGIPIVAPFCTGDVKSAHWGRGGFLVQTFDLPHNGVWNNGFLITVESQKILYMTDFEYCQYVFKKQKINHILIECNYIPKLVDRDIPNYEHKLRGHCSLPTCIGFIKANKTDSLKTVILCHLSAENADPEEMTAEVQKVANCPVYVAEKGLQIELRGDEPPF